MNTTLAQSKYQLTGMRGFTLVWFGQMVSTIGSELTWFALGVWIFQETGSTTLFAFGLLAFYLPSILVSPFAGAITDRWNRKWVMALSDSGAAVCTLLIWSLAFSDRLQVWHVYTLVVLSSSFNALQWPAFSAATTLLVPKKHLGRAGGMVQIGRAVAELIAPATAGAIYLTSGLDAVILVDYATFAFAVLSLAAVHIPRPPKTPAGAAAQGTFWQDTTFGWKYVAARKGLLALLVYFALVNFSAFMFYPLVIPMMLKMSEADVTGLVLSAFGFGMLAGTLVMSAWGGPKRRILGVIIPAVAAGVFLMLVGFAPTLGLIALLGAGYFFLIPIISGSSQALWQAKVPPDIQGRVFSVRRVIADSTMPLAFLVAGPLADKVFEPLLVEGGTLANTVGKVTGIGEGRGTGLLFVILGLLIVLISLGALTYPRLRRVDDEIPDAIPDEPDIEERVVPGLSPAGRTADQDKKAPSIPAYERVFLLLVRTEEAPQNPNLLRRSHGNYIKELQRTAVYLQPPSSNGDPRSDA